VTESMTRSSKRFEMDLDPRRFNEKILELGWGDGLPCLAPTEELVGEYLAATSRKADDVVSILQPLGAECTVEKIAINAAMTGAPPEAMPLLCAFVEAIGDPDFCLGGVNATTASVVPAVIVNGPVRHEVGIPFGHSCFGGMGGAGASIGRATRLIVRNVAGQAAGLTSESIFGQPGRVVGLVTGEWEERSPWLPLAERRGVAGNALTVFGTMGTSNIVDTLQVSGEHLLHLIGGAAAYMGANGLYLYANTFSEFAIALNPIWAETIAKEFPVIEDVTQILWEHASLPVSELPVATREAVENLGRVQPNGRVHQVRSPDDIVVFVAGGEGALHAAMLPGFTASLAVTRAIGT
jgi:hypothetical protein